MAATQRPFVVSHNVHEPLRARKDRCGCSLVIPPLLFMLVLCIILNTYLYCLYVRMEEEVKGMRLLSHDVERLKAEMEKLANKTDRKPMMQPLKSIGLQESESYQYKSVGAVNIDDDDLLESDDPSDDPSDKVYDDEGEDDADYTFSKNKPGVQPYDNRHPPPAPGFSKRNNSTIISTGSLQANTSAAGNDQSSTTANAYDSLYNVDWDQKNADQSASSASTLASSGNVFEPTSKPNLLNSRTGNIPRPKRHAKLMSSKDFNVVKNESTDEKDEALGNGNDKQQEDEIDAVSAVIGDYKNQSFPVKPNEPKNTSQSISSNQTRISTNSSIQREKSKRNRVLPADSDRSTTVDVGQHKVLRSEKTQAEIITQQKSGHPKKSIIRQRTDGTAQQLTTIAETSEIQGGGNQINILIAAHFDADSTSVKHQPNYKGNNRYSHPTGVYKEWKPSDWHEYYQINDHLTLIDGNISISTEGLYFVYAQIFFQDNSDINGFRIFKNSNPVLQCITTNYSSSSSSKSLESITCYTGGIVHCSAGDKLSVKSDYTNRHLVLESSKSFFGVFKLG